MLVAVGESHSGVTNSVELIDLETEEATSSDLPDFPLKLSSAVGFVNLDGKPEICGGAIAGTSSGNQVSGDSTL